MRAAPGCLLLLTCGCVPEKTSEVLVLTACDAATFSDNDAPCEKIADGTSTVSVQACIPEGVPHPWATGSEGAPDMTLSLKVSGGTWLTTTSTSYSAVLGAHLRCVTPQIVVSTSPTIHVEATFLDDLQTVDIDLAPAVIEVVTLVPATVSFEGDATSSVSFTATPYSADGADVSDGTYVTFAATPTPAGPTVILSPTMSYLNQGVATSILTIQPGATSVLVTAMAQAPHWDGEVPAAVSGSFTLYAN